jgi:site-specific DNA-cytosine methylase
MDDRPLAIDLFTGLHGWSEGLVAEGFRVIGFDIEDMCGQFSQPRPEHVRLVIQDVLSIHGSQFRKASLIVASPPARPHPP